MNLDPGNMATNISSTAISVIIPVYNSEKSIDQLVDSLGTALEGLTDEFEVIMVDDGSDDQSFALIERAAARYPWLKPVALDRNFGQHNALLCGIQMAKHPLCVTIDDDLQFQASDIGKLVDALLAGYDLVYGKPSRAQRSFCRDVCTRIARKLMGLLIDKYWVAWGSSFRAFRRELRQSFVHFSGRYIFLDELLCRKAEQVTHVYVSHRPRKEGKSNYSIKRLIRLALNALFMARYEDVVKVTTTLKITFAVIGGCTILLLLSPVLLSCGNIQYIIFLFSFVLAVLSAVMFISLVFLEQMMVRIVDKLKEYSPYEIRQRNVQQYVRK